MFVYKLVTSIDTKMASWPIFVFSIKFIKSVVSLMHDCWFCAIGWSKISINEDIRSVGPSQTDIYNRSTDRFRSVDFCKCVENGHPRRTGGL